MPKSSYCLVYCPCPDKAEAIKISDALLALKLVACANVTSGVQSRYWWKGKIETASESVILLKTRSDLFPELKKTIEKLHSYSTPAILKLSIESANAPFLKWIDDSVEKSSQEIKKLRSLAGSKKIN